MDLRVLVLWLRWVLLFREAGTKTTVSAAVSTSNYLFYSSARHKPHVKLGHVEHSENIVTKKRRTPLSCEQKAKLQQRFTFFLQKPSLVVVLCAWMVVMALKVLVCQLNQEQLNLVVDT